jgi:hypothetical protein
MIGEHNEEIYCGELGLTKAELEKLKTKELFSREAISVQPSVSPSFPHALSRSIGLTAGGNQGMFGLDPARDAGGDRDF